MPTIAHRRMGKAMKLIHVTALRDHIVLLGWESQSETEVDLSLPIFGRRSGVKLRNNWELFSTVKVRADGGAITWPEVGADIPVEQLLRMPAGEMTTAQFRAVCDELAVGSEGIAAALGMSRRAITDYKGGAPIPKSVAHAMRYLRSKAISEIGVLI